MSPSMSPKNEIFLDPLPCLVCQVTCQMFRGNGSCWILARRFFKWTEVEIYIKSPIKHIQKHQNRWVLTTKVWSLGWSSWSMLDIPILSVARMIRSGSRSRTISMFFQADRPKVKQLTNELLQLKCQSLWTKRPLHQRRELISPWFHQDFTSHRKWFALDNLWIIYGYDMTIMT